MLFCRLEDNDSPTPFSVLSTKYHPTYGKKKRT